MRRLYGAASLYGSSDEFPLNGVRHQAMLARLKGERLPQVRYLVVDTEDLPFEGTLDLASQMAGERDRCGRVHGDAYNTQWIYPPAADHDAASAVANPDYVSVS